MSQKMDLKVFRDLSYGLYIVTSRNGDRLNGQIINTAIQVTSDPARVAVIINKKNLTHEFIDKSKVFALSVLVETAPMTFIGLFGFKSGRDIDKLSKTQFKEGVTKCPLVTEHSFLCWRQRSWIRLTLAAIPSSSVKPSAQRSCKMVNR